MADMIKKATRESYGEALVELADINEKHRGRLYVVTKMY